MAKINLSDVGEFKAMPAGTYRAALTGFELKQSKTGNDYIKAEFTIQDDEFSGRKQWKNYSLLPQSLWVMKSELVKMGCDVDLLNDPEGIDPEEIFAGMIGAMCKISISVRQYNGKDTNNIEKVDTDTGGLF